MPNLFIFQNIEHLDLVVKAVVQSEYLKIIFQPSITFVKETRFYSTIIKTLEEFEVITNIPEQERMDMFFKTIGSRISLNKGKLLLGISLRFKIIEFNIKFQMQLKLMKML